MRKTAVLLGMLLLVMTVQLAVAEPISAFNNRPVTIGVSDEATLQSLLNSIYGTGVVSAANDQQNAGMWKQTGASPTAPSLQYEIAWNASSNKFGIWYAADTNDPIKRLEVFSGAATGNEAGDTHGSSATIQWYKDGSIVVGGSGPGINSGIHSGTGISNNAFGFYLQVGDQYYYSVDQLNPNGSAQMLAYREPDPNLWVLAFEDSQVGRNSDRDYNDMVLSIESITPVPEPASLVLLGSGLVSLGGMLRRKRS